MTLELLPENPRLPYNRDKILRGGTEMAGYLWDLVQSLEKEHLRLMNYYVNHMRQIMTFMGGESCDATHAYTLPFTIPDETNQILSLKLSFWIYPFRAHSTGAASGGGATSSDGGAATITSASGGGATVTSAGGGGATITSAAGGQQTTGGGGGATVTSASGGGQTTGGGGGYTGSTDYQNVGTNGKTGTADGSVGNHEHTLNETSQGHYHGLVLSNHDHSVSSHTHSVTIADHTHTVADHTHSVTVASHTHDVTVSAHTHSVTLANHTHTVPAHTHNLVFGIYEEVTVPTIHFHVDDGNGAGAASDDYMADQRALDITAQVTGTGAKAIIFHTDARCYIAAQLELKVNITTAV